MANFYKINKDYINTFGLRVVNRYKDNDKRSETAFFKALLEELHELFRKFGGKLSSKRNIPSAEDYPDSVIYNKLINDIGFDLDKLYNAQKLIESDVNNLLNFNSNQRIKIFEEMTTAQQEVYSAYIKSKRDVIGGVEVPAGNAFTSADNLSADSEDVTIDEERQVLTIATEGPPVINKNVDIRNTTIYFAGKLPNRPIYPAGETLGVGSHWKTRSNDPHFINVDNPSDLEIYKTMMIDDPNNNIGIGFCEFEAVRTRMFGLPSITMRTEMRASATNYGVLFVPVFSRTRTENSAIITLREYIGQRYGKDPELVYADIANSLQGQYAITGLEINIPNDSIPKYKLIVPFTSQVLTNELIIDLSANSEGYLPKINWAESKVFGKLSGGDVANALIPPRNTLTDLSLNGRYICHTHNYIYPTRLELILEYETDQLMWTPIDFYMAHYVYSAEKPYELPYYDNDSKLNVVLRKSYDIFVDAEANDTKERARALNVLRSSKRSS